MAGIGVLAALLLIVVGHRRAAPNAEIEAVAAEVDALVRETTAGVEARAATLAQLPRLGWIVATDEATVGDLTADELEFRPHAGERIELSQVRSSDGQVRLLRRLPAGKAQPLPVSKPGPRLIVSGGGLEVVTVMTIRPRLRAEELHGALAVAKTLDTTALVRRLDALGFGVRVQAPGGAVTLGRGAPVADRGAATRALTSPAAEGAVLVAAAGGRGGAGRVLLWLLLLLGFGGAAAVWRWGAEWLALPRARTATPTRTPTPSRPAPPPAGSSIARSGGLVVDDEGRGTDLTYDPDATVLADPALSPQIASSRARSGSVPIVSSPAGTGPHWNGPTTKDADGETDPTTLEYRSLFAEFVALRRTCGEPTADLDRDDFVTTLRRTRERLIKDDVVSDVRFRLAFANGRAVIRFTTVP